MPKNAYFFGKKVHNHRSGRGSAPISIGLVRRLITKSLLSSSIILLFTGTSWAPI